MPKETTTKPSTQKQPLEPNYQPRPAPDKSIYYTERGAPAPTKTGIAKPERTT